jgi:hypothetical protein
MNRDEKLARPQGLPPKLTVVQNRQVIFPSEPAGGTWIATNEFGVSLALINWYSVPTRFESSPISRGEVVKATCTAGSPNRMEAVLATLPLDRIKPFRLIAFFPASSQITECRWDLNKLELKTCAWQTQQWISSGFDEPAAQRERSRTFQQALKEKSVGSLSWLRRLHRSHSPEEGPFSICMHRADAATVSYTEIVVLGHDARLWHCLGPPCQPQKQFTVA